MRLVTLVAVPIISFTIILPCTQARAQQKCTPDSGCDELSKCAPFEKNDPLYRKWVECAASGFFERKGPSTTRQNKGGLPFQSVVPSR